MSTTRISTTSEWRRKSVTGSSRGNKTILPRKSRRTDKGLLLILDNGKDVTPKSLNPDLFSSGTERQLTGFEGLDRIQSQIGDPTQSTSTHVCANIFKSRSTARFRTDLEQQSRLGTSSSVYRGSVESSYVEEFLLEEEEKGSEPSIRVSSSTVIVKNEVMKTPQQVSLTLNETNTFILLDIPSSTAEKDTEEGNAVEEQNQQYEFLTVGKGRNRKVLHAEVQTISVLKKTRYTTPEKVKHHTNTAFASNWEMYDTYQETEAEASSEDSDTSDEVQDIEEQHNKLDDLTSLDSYRISLDEKQWNKLQKNPKFLEAVCVLERLLANNCYNEQQKRFIGLKDPSEFRENIEYKYNLNLLWTFANSDTAGFQGKSVNAMHWNPVNKHLLAVGYGKFYFTSSMRGTVCIWNIKNPVQPERQYHFTRSVMALNFSKSDPNLLAVGLYNGHIMVLNITSREKMVVGENVPTFEPVWYLCWRTSQYELNNKEQVCAAFDDGRVIAYSVARKLEGQEIMRVPKTDGKLKGYDSMGKCSNLSIPVSRYAAALFVTQHPADETIYFIGTTTGVIHKCSTNYFNQHLDHFLAHDGPVCLMKFSPFSKKIYATCGDDWHTRIWAEDISEPLFELYTSMQSIDAFDWSPTHSTILVTILGADILIWDFQRKVYEPQSVTHSPTGCKNTIVQFIDTGRCLVVGDIEGNVHVFSLEDMPFMAFFQENLLFDSLFRALITNPMLLHKLKKLRKGNDDK